MLYSLIINFRNDYFYIRTLTGYALLQERADRAAIKLQVVLAEV
jgi:hypothetical protein